MPNFSKSCIFKREIDKSKFAAGTLVKQWVLSVEVQNGIFTSKSEFTLVSVQFGSVPRAIRSSQGHEGRFSRDPLPVFSAGGPWFSRC